MKAAGRTSWRNEHVKYVLDHSKKFMPLLMNEIENDNMCSEPTKFFANVKVTTLNKPDKQDPTAPPKDFRPIGSGEPLHKISQNPLAREMNAHFARKLAKLGQFGMCPDGITLAGILPAIILEMPKFENAALGLADVTSAFRFRSGDGRESWGAVTKGQGGIAADGRHGCHQEGRPPPEARPHDSAGTSRIHVWIARS